MKALFTSLLVVFIPVLVWCQSFDIVAKLPGVCAESSGLEVINENLFITHNDGGDDAKLYFIDSSGVVQREIIVGQQQNTDWEDITLANDGRVYVGDFGNNGHNRKDLEIIVLPDFNSWKTDTVNAEKITFRYADQSAFPPEASNRVFDCEAMAFYNDSLYLFSKNWSNPFTGMVKMYVVPATPGDYVLSPQDSINLGVVKEIGWVTGADINDSTLYLVGSALVWKFQFQGRPSLQSMEQISLNHFSQKEAISYYKNDLYITDESTGGYGNMYRYTKTKTNSATSLIKDNSCRIVQTQTDCHVLNPNGNSLKLSLYDLTGKMVSSSGSIKTEQIFLHKYFPNSIISPGIYWLHVDQVSEKSFWGKIYISE